MEAAQSRAAELREQATAVRVRAIETNRAIAEEMTSLLRELNALVGTEPELRRLRERIARDIALLEKLELALDTEWLDESKHARPKPNPEQE